MYLFRNIDMAWSRTNITGISNMFLLSALSFFSISPSVLRQTETLINKCWDFLSLWDSSECYSTKVKFWYALMFNGFLFKSVLYILTPSYGSKYHEKYWSTHDWHSKIHQTHNIEHLLLVFFCCCQHSSSWSHYYIYAEAVLKILISRRKEYTRSF